ncbi:ATP-binding protein [Azohydromonas aeria]|uniref:ATP-binding protein n=1 Tax=Azohydromonas aeria TaxID=2590212 RepID=UPI0012F76BED|nr:winged helix-turn-helix domain-containing protein [Azohydromonas aeria]
MQPLPPPPESHPRAARFGDFVLAPARRRLLRRGQPVRLSDRALDLLVVLVQRRGEVVAKQQLLTLAWPGVVVEESNLRVQVAALRRALDDPSAAPRFVASVPGRGYAFVADVAWEPDPGERRAAPLARDGAPPVPRQPLALPLSARPLVGRDDLVSAVQYELALRRLITLTGPGGIGKTAVARAVGARSGRAYADGVQLLDLSALSHGSLVLPHLASRLCLPAGPSALGAVVEHLRTRHLLLILDNCEHVVEAVCALAQELLAQCPGVDLLATSREALRAGGEYVKRLQPLGVPPESETLSRESALEYAALRLLAERIEAQDVRLAFDAAELALLADLCRRLDGLPLALELAATWVPVLGLPGVSALLDQRLARLGGGARDAQPRHRTLAATIDWSYDTLSADEQALFRQLGAFRAPFTLEAVEAVCRLRGGDAAAQRALEGLGRLVDRSLVSVELAERPPRYRLFESLRRYALEKLADAGELRAAREAHARQVLAHCRRAAAEPEALPDGDGLRREGGDVADIRAALDWAFAPDGDARLAVALVLASVPLWRRLLLEDELQERLRQAIGRSRELELDEVTALLRSRDPCAEGCAGRGLARARALRGA